MPITHKGNSPSAKIPRREIDQLERVLSKYFKVRDDELLVGGVPISTLVEEYGSPQFVYDKAVILRKIQEARSVFTERFRLFYSIKANPNASILKLFLREGCGLEVASAGELFQALAAGCSPDRIIFAGPGKSEDEIAAAIEASIREIHVESIEEAKCINRLAKQRNKVSAIALRINPTDTPGGAMQMGGKASPFGIDEENIDQAIDEILGCRHLHICGIHLFMGTQILDAETLMNQYHRAVSIAKRVASRVGPLETIDFGGGWGTPYFPHEQELDLDIIASGISSIDALLAADPLLENATAIVEPGRFLINEAGIYLCKVTRIKQSRGKKFVIVDGGMHHHLAASGNLGQTIKRNYPLAIVNKLGQPRTETTEIVGPLCTPLDTIGRGVQLPVAGSDDLIGVFLSGAYARASSPLGFLSHDTPVEIMAFDGKATLIRRRGNPKDYTRDQ